MHEIGLASKLMQQVAARLNGLGQSPLFLTITKVRRGTQPGLGGGGLVGKWGGTGTRESWKKASGGMVITAENNCTRLVI